MIPFLKRRIVLISEPVMLEGIRQAGRKKGKLQAMDVETVSMIVLEVTDLHIVDKRVLSVMPN